MLNVSERSVRSKPVLRPVLPCNNEPDLFSQRAREGSGAICCLLRIVRSDYKYLQITSNCEESKSAL